MRGVCQLHVSRKGGSSRHARIWARLCLSTRTAGLCVVQLGVQQDEFGRGRALVGLHPGAHGAATNPSQKTAGGARTQQCTHPYLEQRLPCAHTSVRLQHAAGCRRETGCGRVGDWQACTIGVTASNGHSTDTKGMNWHGMQRQALQESRGGGGRAGRQGVPKRRGARGVPAAGWRWPEPAAECCVSATAMQARVVTMVERQAPLRAYVAAPAQPYRWSQPRPQLLPLGAMRLGPVPWPACQPGQLL